MFKKIRWCVEVPLAVLTVYVGTGLVILALLDGAGIEATIVLSSIAVVVVLVARVLRPGWVRFEPEPRSSGRFWWWLPAALVVAFFAGQALAMGLYELVGSSAFDASVAARAQVDGRLAAALTLVAAPMSEEAMFRGVIYPLLRRRITVLVAALVSAVTFAAVHGNIVQATAALPLALLMALVYERTRSLLLVVAIHMAYNASALALDPGVVEALANPAAAGLLVIGFGVLFALLYREVQPGSGDA